MPLAVPPVFALGHTIPFALGLSKPVLSRVEGGFVLRGDTEGFD